MEWCEGILKIRGDYDNIKGFLLNELRDGTFKSRVYEDDIVLSIYSSRILSVLDTSGGNKAFIEAPIHLYNGSSFIAAKFVSVTDLDKEILIKNSDLYQLDFKIYACVPQLEINREFEVNKGIVVQDELITYSDYKWDSPII